MPGNPLTDENWAAEVTGQITGLVGNIRDKTTNNAIKLVRAIVFGLFVAMIAVVAVVLLLLVLTRGLQVLLDLILDWDRAVYASYLILGAVMIGVGFLLMKRRTSGS